MAPELQPYVGPRPFERGDQVLFFGRDHEISELLSLIVAHGEVLVYAQSGAGKTSLFNAGVIPLLETKGFDVLPLARVRGSIPQSIKAEEIANFYVFNALLSWAENGVGPDQLIQTTLSDYLRHRKRLTDKNSHPLPSVVIFDQFEELFSSVPERWEDRGGFFEQVRDGLEEDPLLRVVFIIREDYLAQLDPYARLMPEKLRTRFRLERMGREAALHAVVGPLAGTGRSYANGVAEKLVEEMLKVRVETAADKSEIVMAEFIEPVQLQVVCQSLWQELPSAVTVVTQDHLHVFGDVSQALTKFYERSIERAAQATHVSEGDLREWFEHRLITPAGTRGSVYQGRERSDGIPNAAIKVLEDLHLIRGEWRAGARWYELTHDRLIEPIQKANRQWLTEYWEAEQARKRLEAKAAEWVDMGRGEGALLDAIELHEAQRWLECVKRAKLDYSANVTALIESSRAAIEKGEREQEATRRRELEQARALAAAETARAEEAEARRKVESERTGEARRSARRANWLSAAMVVLFVLAGAFAWSASQAKKDAERQKEVAEQNVAVASARQLSGVAMNELEEDPERSILLALQAISKTYSRDRTVIKEAQEALHFALRTSRTRVALPSYPGVSRVVVSPTLIVTASLDGTVRLWDVFSGLEKSELLIPSFRGALNVEFNPVPSGLARSYGIDKGSGALINEPTKGGSADKAGLRPNDVILKIDDKKIEKSTDLVEVVTAFQPGTRVKVEFIRQGRLQTLEAVLGGRPIQVVTIGSDGTHLAVASWRTVQVWANIASDKAKAIFSLENDAAVNDVAFSPDGLQLATAGERGIVTLWNVQTGQKLLTLPPVTQLDLGIDVRQMIPEEARGLANTETHGVVVRQVTEDAPAFRADIEPDDAIVRIDGKAIGTPADFYGAIKGLAPGRSSRVELVRKGKSKTVVTGVDKRPVEVSSLAYSPDGARLAIAYGSGNSSVKLWDTRSGKAGLTLLDTATVGKIAFSATGKVLATVSAGWTTTVWDLTSGEAKFALQHDDAVNDVAFSPDGKMLATAGRDRRVDLWESNSGKKLFSLAGHRGPIQAVAFSPDGEELVTASEDKTARVWEIHQQQGLTLPGHQGAIWGLSFSSDGKRLATASLDGTARVSDFNTGEELISLSGHEGGVTNVAFGPGGRSLATAGIDGFAKIWDAASGRELKTLIGHEDRLYSLAFNRDGTRLATASRDGTARLWDPVSGEKLFVLAGHRDTVLGVAFSPDGKRLATASWDKNIKIWDVATGKEQLTLPSRHKDRVWRLAFSPDGKYLASFSADGTAILWDLSSNEASHVFMGHAGQGDVAFSPDGKWLAIASGDKTIKLWNVSSRKETLALSGQVAAINRVVFSPDGKFLVAGSSDGTAHIYALGAEDLMALARRRISRSLTEEECKKYLEQESCPPPVKALELFVRGKTLAEAGNIEGAVASFQEALTQDPNLGFDPQKEAKWLAAATLIAEGNRSARLGDLKIAIQGLQRARQLVPELEFDPQTKAKRLDAMALFAKGADYAEHGKVKEAIAVDEEAQRLDPTLNAGASHWNTLCWFGSLYQNAKDIIFACEQAVSLCPYNGQFRDSRGVARALLGNFKGAIDDFEAAYADPNLEQRKRKPRQQWVASLRKGKNPFTQEELKKLFND